MIRLAAAAWSGGTGVTAEATCQAALLIADSYPYFPALSRIPGMVTAHPVCPNPAYPAPAVPSR